MSRIHDALRRAEWLGLHDFDPAMDILRESATTPVLSETDTPTEGQPKAIRTQSLPYSPMTSDTFAGSPASADCRTSDTTQATAFVAGQYRQSKWSTPDSDALLFLQPEEHHQLEREQFRTLRSRLAQICANEAIRTVLISSSLPGEGKTFVAANLAMVIVRQKGRRVLLIDADLRKPGLHTLFGAQSAPGLTEYLAGESDETSVIQQGPVANFCFTPAGKLSSNSGELIGNGRLAQLIARTAPSFDWIVIDSPPALAVSDASVIATASDGVLLVLKAGSTPFDIARKACAEFRCKRILGIVLNHAGTSAQYEASYYRQYGKPGITRGATAN